MIWANLIHLSRNMWIDREHSEVYDERAHCHYRPYLRFDEPLWREILERMSAIGMNMVLIDLGDAVKWRSHRDIAVEGAWTRRKLRDELQRARDLGLEPIPKLNFSTCHDAWLGKYSRMVSTEPYYQVCADLIAEAAEIFDGPRFFHLGMDEESVEFAHLQKPYAYACFRHHELWWNDVHYFIEQTEKTGSRGWVWSDYIWHHKEEYGKNMPKSMVQSTWCYDPPYNKSNTRLRGALDLEDYKYDQIPTTMNRKPHCFEQVMMYCRRYLPRKRFLGMMQTTWMPTQADYRDKHMHALDEVERGIRKWEKAEKGG